MLSRYQKNILFAAVTRLSLLVCIGILAFLLITITIQGIRAFSLSFFLTPARDFGASGGILYQISGSLLLVIVAGLLVLPFAVGTAIYRSECVQSERVKRALDQAIFCLNSIPSVTYGLFGLILFVNIFNTGISWFVGSIILAIMMLPTVTITTYQAMNSIPDFYRENGFALGLNRMQVIRRIVLPQSFHGVTTGLLIGLARAVGETAPIMFIATAFSGVTVPNSLNEPVSTLPTHILALAQQATNPDALRNAWGSSLTLIILVMIFSSLAYVARLKFKTLSQR